MTPENRVRMRAVLRDSLQHAYLPGSHAHGQEPAAGSHDAAMPHATGRAAPTVADPHTTGRAAPTPSSHDPRPTAADPRGMHAREPATQQTAPETPATPPTAAGTAADPGATHARGRATPLTAAGTPATPLTPGDRDALAARFCQELEALAGVAYRADSADAAADHVASILARSQTTAMLGWSIEEIGVPGLGEALAARGLSLVPPEVPFADPERAERLETLAALAVGLTGAQAAIADSGSLVLVSGPGRSRLASLLTPIHVAILQCERILPSLSDLFRVHPDLVAHGSNLVIVTGPSRTADIEMTLSRGVHGPREIHVVLV